MTWLVPWLCGAFCGGCWGFVFAWERYLRLPDPIGDGLRRQMKRVADQRRLYGLDADWVVASIATIESAGETYECIVRQPCAMTQETTL